MPEVEKNEEYCAELERQNKEECPRITKSIFKYTFHGCKIGCEVAESVFAKFRVCMENTVIEQYEFTGDQIKTYLAAVDRQIGYVLKKYDYDSQGLSLNLMYRVYWKQAPGAAYERKSKEDHMSDKLEVSKFGEDKRPNPEQAYLKAEECHIIRKGLKYLSEEEQRIVKLRIYENKTWQQIADILGNKNANAPFQRYGRILPKLREMILIEHQDYVDNELSN